MDELRIDIEVSNIVMMYLTLISLYSRLREEKINQIFLKLNQNTLEHEHTNTLYPFI